MSPVRALCLTVLGNSVGEYVPKIDAESFDVWRLKVLKRVKTSERAHRLEFRYRGQPVSPWHDIPFWAGYYKEEGQPLLHFVCEIPRLTHAKLEIHKGHPPNPLIQDTIGNNRLRFYKYGESIVNYGAIAQTWENPNLKDPDTGLVGDNDPIDVLQLNSKPCRRGAIQRVRVLGALALVDGGETDWKLLAVDVDDSSELDAKNWRRVDDISEDYLGEIREWFRKYKTAEGKTENIFALDGNALDEKQALRAAQRTHRHWRDLVSGKATCFAVCQDEVCSGKEIPCWVGSDDGADL